MKPPTVNEKAFRKRMIDMGIKSINDLATRSGVSRPTIYELLNGKSPISPAFIKLCDFLEKDPMELLEKPEE